MATHRIKSGLDVPVDRAPEPPIEDASGPRQIALLADDFPGLKARLAVDEGSRVRRGELLFEDRKVPGIRFTSPGAGRVVEIHRGERRALQSVVVELDDSDEAMPLASYRAGNARDLVRSDIARLLLESGLWTALRQRPYNKVPAPDTVPDALFITAIDTQPLAIDPALVIAEAREDFELGLAVLTKLTGGKTFLCVAEGSKIGAADAPVSVETFAGPHPAGLAGLHIHLLAPVSRDRVVWTVGYQDVIAVGRLFRTGELDPERIISIAGPAIARPRLVRTRLGASVTELTAEDALGDDVRLISGSMISGKAVTKPRYGFLGRYESQVTALPEGREREFLGWLAPGRRRFSVLPIFLSKWIRSKTELTTSTHGGSRAMVPIGVYERVMPMDILPTFLLRAMLAGDVERAEALGCLELAEEDLALCTFVCPSKIDYGPVLRRTLNELEAGR